MAFLSNKINLVVLSTAGIRAKNIHEFLIVCYSTRSRKDDCYTNSATSDNRLSALPLFERPPFLAQRLPRGDPDFIRCYEFERDIKWCIAAGAKEIFLDFKVLQIAKRLSHAVRILHRVLFRIERNECCVVAVRANHRCLILHRYALLLSTTI